MTYFGGKTNLETLNKTQIYTLMLQKQKSRNNKWFSFFALNLVVSSRGPQRTCSWKQVKRGTCLSYIMLCLLMVGLLGCR